MSTIVFDFFSIVIKNSEQGKTRHQIASKQVSQVEGK